MEEDKKTRLMGFEGSERRDGSLEEVVKSEGKETRQVESTRDTGLITVDISVVGELRRRERRERGGG